MSLSVEVRGLKETQAKLEQVVRDLEGDTMLQGMRQATLLVQRSAKMLAPVDTGRLRASIAPEVRAEGTEVIGVVGSNLTYAPYMELGTGIHAGHAAYFPPPEALEVWARRHGTTGYAVALAIFRRGGLKPRHFLQQALEENQERIIQYLQGVVSGIVEE